MLTDEQASFLKDQFQQSKNDVLIQDLTYLKGVGGKKGSKNLDLLGEVDRALNNWTMEINVSPTGTRTYQCICGRKIKNQYLVKHLYKDISISLGSEHFKTYMGITSTKAKGIINGNEAYTAAIEEVKEGLENKLILRQLHYLDDSQLPKSYRQQLNLGLPLIKKQVGYIKRTGSQKTFDLFLGEIKEKDLSIINALSSEERETLIIQLKNGESIKSIDALDSIDFDDIKDKEVIVEDNLPTYISPDEIEAVKSLFSMMDLGIKSYMFIKGVKSIEEQISIANNTFDQKKMITRRERPSRFSSKLDRQVKMKLALSDLQWQAFWGDDPHNAYPWKSY